MPSKGSIKKSVAGKEAVEETAASTRKRFQRAKKPGRSSERNLQLQRFRPNCSQRKMRIQTTSLATKN